MYILIDNYDSFTYNLYHYFLELGAKVEVYRNDKILPKDILKKKYKGIILSPGPCTPNEAGICLDLIKEISNTKIPTLGVCLGHQVIGQAFGGKIIKNKPMHGKVSSIYHFKSDLFKNLSNPFNATRYHSLSIERKSLPSCLKITAELKKNGMIMGVRHKKLPIYGVQFHPESIASQHGHDLIKNFLKLSK
ncbi:MAG: Anthranilate synthase component 2 [Alphaproteobacteria bacterium MarineAlpha6_Bin4]|nr:MAG: Anthranilate synthase component 2 [Alphaproteobacteria bacterium MarineAlpha6_Bin4]|tara:strand:- start:1918 stop:2490 length:573 start_codon:yes stop_codon:yes gene_type:complete